VTILYPVDEYGLGPTWSVSAQYLMFLPLVTRSPEGELEPCLAESWEHSPDYKEWTIRLRTDVRWHDGVPVTANDLAFTLELLAQPETGFAAQRDYTVSVVDDRTYTIRYTKRSIGHPLDDFTVYYPKHHLEGLDPSQFYEWEFWKHPVGNGPYRWHRTEPGLMIELQANPDYFRGKPAIDRVVFKFGEGSLVELLSGNVDVLPYVSEVDLLALGRDEHFATYRWVNTGRVKTVAWNHDHELFQDPEIRQALTLAIDRQGLLRLLNLPEELPLFDTPFTERQFRDRDPYTFKRIFGFYDVLLLLPPAAPYDPERARQVLEAAGWRDLDGNGVRERGDTEFRFDLLIPTGGGAWGAQGSERAAIYLQEQLRRVGVSAEIATMDGMAFRERFRSGDFEAAIQDITSGSKHLVFGEGSPIGYRRPEVIELLDRMRHTLDPVMHDNLQRELAAIFRRDQPVTFLYPSVVTTVAHRRIRGLSTPFRADPVWYMEHLWIEEER
jgi:peptide/nickel transport system substrate-binding protein